MIAASPPSRQSDPIPCSNDRRTASATTEKANWGTPDARALLARAVDGLGLSARGAHRVLRVARTVADLAGE
jgi:magnesium chelatase family protein